MLMSMLLTVLISSVAFTQDYYDDAEEDSLTSPYAPTKESLRHNGIPYVITDTRLKKLRSQFMYWFWDQGGGGDNEGDWQKAIQTSSPQVHKNLNFQLPFFGFRFNYTRVSMNGYLEFSDPSPSYSTYPLVFPVKDWPKENDPSFIGIFFSKCRIGKMRTEDIDKRKEGVYFRLERDLQTRRDQFGVEVRERVKWDIREGIIGAETFNPKHVIITTWKNISFAGGISSALSTTNTFQLVLATDEVFTYAIFNYLDLQWTSHTAAGGDTLRGDGGIPAFVGFNAGNGTRSYEYHPYSQSSVINDLTETGWGNGFKGRHIFRIDENIMLGSCNPNIDGANLPLVFAPTSGNMLGGTVVNITGPCFEPGEIVKCKFDPEHEVYGTVVDRNRAICIQPFVFAEGYVRFEIAAGKYGKYKWRGKYFIETPATAEEKVFFEDNSVHEKHPNKIKISWIKHNLTINEKASIRISLWGYRETNIRPEFLYIDKLISGIKNTGSYTINPAAYRFRENKNLTDIKFGFLQINLTEPIFIEGTETRITPLIWSRPIPLGWYFAPQWRQEHGRHWTKALCDDWIQNDRHLRNFTHKLSQCPCTLEQALANKGRYLPDFDCDKDSNPRCQNNRGAIHCVRTGSPTLEGFEQQCCYDRYAFLMISHDQQWGSSPSRSHNHGSIPWNETRKAPTLSHWYNDMTPKYLCCLWQHEQAAGCETLRFERRPTQHCVNYEAPAIAGVYGDPHIITFDDVSYTFNGKGEFVLVRSNNNTNRLDIQARFEQMSAIAYGEVMATQVTSIVARGNTSTTIEVRIRPKDAQWRYRLDVFANGRRIYFDRPSIKFQHFLGVTVYSPTYILNQSEVVIMFDSGAGVEVVENKGFMTARVYLPTTYINQTSGLFGNWNFNKHDDLTDPNDQVIKIPVVFGDLERIYYDFGLKWMLQDLEDPKKGGAMFMREYGKTSAYYNNITFKPEFRMVPEDILPPNRSISIVRAYELCGEHPECRYDYTVTLNRDLAHFTVDYKNSISHLKEINRQQFISCGILETPKFGRKSTFMFIPKTRVMFECNEGFELIGDRSRQCNADGSWDLPRYGYTKCLHSLKSSYGPPHIQHGYEIPYVLTERRLKEIRSQFMYWYWDKGVDHDNLGDWQTNINASQPKLRKNLNFQLPFFGYRFNYTTISVDGFLEFSDPPSRDADYPLVFPVKDWPKENDPSFIGIFFSKCRIGKMRTEDIDKRREGVYFRLERDLQTRTDQFGVELLERVKWDIREGIIGAETFIPKHVITTTWKNISFAGGISSALSTTNTFQLVLATDEVFTYAIFNYLDLQWTSHTAAGGDTLRGDGGIPAFVGFNAGNGTRSYEYHPYSQSSVINDLTETGWGNGFKGRHIFRIDENIMLGSCNPNIDGANLPLVFAPTSGNMLGGTVVNITGPCFEPGEIVKCKFDAEHEVYGTVVDRNRVICIQPFVFAEGYVRFEIAVGKYGRYKWRGTYFIETPATAAEKVFFEDNSVYEKHPTKIKISWAKRNLTINENANIRISLWGYRETTMKTEFLYIDEITSDLANTGSYSIDPKVYSNRQNKNLTDIKFGFLQINLTEPIHIEGTETRITPLIWSRPIPLGWYFEPQWRQEHGIHWTEELCDDWIQNDKYLKNFTQELPPCPCTLDQALANKGRYLPDFDCDRDSNPRCQKNLGAIHCVRTGSPTLEGFEQQCCYDKNSFLMISHDQQWGSSPSRSHNLGSIPWNETRKAPTLSHWYNDVTPKYLCCLWQHEKAAGCETLRFERRPTQHCVNYEAPAIAGVYGDPHIITFDDVSYTFNGEGEFVLVRSNNNTNRLNIQARFEQMPAIAYGDVMATQVTSIVARGNTSTTIEVRIRPKDAQWRYRLDVFANGRRIYFDRPSIKFQHFLGVTVYTPTYILNQSEVVIMFDSGAGVEVVENKGFMTARVYLPTTYINQTSGLFGNWNFNKHDDLTDPNDQVIKIPVVFGDLERIYYDFGLKWMLQDLEDPKKGGAMFMREYGKTSAYYNNITFKPEFRMVPEDILPPNRSISIVRAYELCGEHPECRYDYTVTLNRDLAHFTVDYKNSISHLKEINRQKFISCGILETPQFGRKSSFLFIPGITVMFECNEGFVLIGDRRRQCNADGSWDLPTYGYTKCLRQQESASSQAGITWGLLIPVIVSIVLVIVYVAHKTIESKKQHNKKHDRYGLALPDQTRCTQGTGTIIKNKYCLTLPKDISLL